MSTQKNSFKRSSFLRHTTALFMVLAGGLSMVLFSVKYQVHDLEAQQKRLSKEFKNEHRSLHVLRAEWANLNDPERIKVLAEQFLGMHPVLPNQVIQLSEVEAMAERPIAPVSDQRGRP